MPLNIWHREESRGQGAGREGENAKCKGQRAKEGRAIARSQDEQRR